MKNAFALLLCIFIGQTCLAQCTFNSDIFKNANTCIDTIFAHSSGSISKITWLYENAVDTTVFADSGFSKNGITVAGGNGQGSKANQLTYPGDVFVVPDGEIYVSDPNSFRVVKFPAGSSSLTNGTVVAGGNGPGSAANQVEPDGIYVDVSGNLYVCDIGYQRIMKFPPGSNSATNGIIIAGGNGVGNAPNQFSAPTAFCFDGSGNMYVCDHGNDRIQKFPPGSSSATNGLTVAGGNGTGPAANQFYGAYSVCLDAMGYLYVADFDNYRVQKFPPGSTSATNGFTFAGGNGSGAATNQIAMVASIYLDKQGNLYIFDLGNERVLKFPPGSSSSTYGEIVAGGNGQGSAANQFIGSYGIMVDDAGNIFVVDIDNYRVQEFKWDITIDTMLIPVQKGTYRAVITDNYGCSDTTNTIILNPAPIPTLHISADKTSVCAGDTVLFTSQATNAGSAPDFQWLLNGRNIGINMDSLIINSLVDGDIISCTLTGSTTCTSVVSSDNQVTMAVSEQPTISFDPDEVFIKPRGFTTLDPIINGSISLYQWEPAKGLNNPGIAKPIASPNNNISYTLIVTSNDGCQASGIVKVVVYDSLVMPNAFTPDGDGKNDIFRIPISTPQEIEDFSVYNRWGSIVFKTSNNSLGWDGTFNGNPQPEGVYVWMIKFHDPLTGKTLLEKGTVVLVR